MTPHSKQDVSEGTCMSCIRISETAREYRCTRTSTKFSTKVSIVTQVVKLDRVRRRPILNRLTILVADWQGSHKYVGNRGVSMRNNPDVRDSIFFAPKYLSNFHQGNTVITRRQQRYTCPDSSTG